MTGLYSINSLLRYVLLLCLPVLWSNQCLALETASPEPQMIHPFLKNDPFQMPNLAGNTTDNKLVTATVSGNGLELRGILMSSSNPMVNVNGEVLSVGDVIDGYRLIDVTEINAVFEKQENRITLDLLTELPN